MTYNVYCDESGHLPNDGQPNMVLGATWIPTERVRATTDELRALKRRYGLSPYLELKWTKISPGRLDFYLALIDFFFDRPELRFRALVVPDKSKLDHTSFRQDHDTWYYKMYFSMLKVIINPEDRFRIFIDIKDTRSADKMHKLHDVLCNNIYDFDRSVIQCVQTVRSHEVEILQLADLLIGAVRHAGHGSGGDSAKDKFVRHLQERSHYTLTRSTLLTERKFNLFAWSAQETAR